MQAITTKIIKATKNAPAQVQASCFSLTRYFAYVGDMDQNQNHQHAAAQLCDVLNWGHLMLATGWNSDNTQTHVPLHDINAAPDQKFEGGMEPGTKYRANEIAQVRQKVIDSVHHHAFAFFSVDGGAQSRCFNMNASELAALVALFNRNDTD